MSKLNDIILHIPHSSMEIPGQYVKDYFNWTEVNETILKLTDTYVDDLFNIERLKQQTVIFPYSRCFCDVERFNDDSEEMLIYGQGVLYTHGLNGKHFREYTKTIKNKIIREYYNKHKVNVVNKIKELNDPIVVDCHSFSNEIYQCTPFTCDVLPDFCLGYNEGDIKGETLCNFIEDYLSKTGFNVKINSPYCGSYQIDTTPSIMIEINKRLYLRDDYITKVSDYYKIKNIIKIIIQKIENYVFN